MKVNLLSKSYLAERLLWKIDLSEPGLKIKNRETIGIYEI